MTIGTAMSKSVLGGFDRDLLAALPTRRNFTSGILKTLDMLVPKQHTVLPVGTYPFCDGTGGIYPWHSRHELQIYQVPDGQSSTRSMSG